jgi:hypothetical protein
MATAAGLQLLIRSCQMRRLPLLPSSQLNLGITLCGLHDDLAIYRDRPNNSVLVRMPVTCTGVPKVGSAARLMAIGQARDMQSQAHA